MKANDDLAIITFAEGKGFETTPDEVAVSIGIKKGNTELAGQINKILAGISAEERQKIMDAATDDQPLSE